MSNLRRKPKEHQSIDLKTKFQKFFLTENPFPTSPVNKESTDPRINGEIYEADIRTKEYNSIETAFLKKSQADPSHLRLGYIIDESYIGRGNGKSAFLVNLIRIINTEYCLDISGEINKCFALYLSPEPGGRTKTFDSFIDLLFKAIYSSGIIATSLASLRMDAILNINPDFIFDDVEDHELIENLNSEDWIIKNEIDHVKIMESIWENKFLQKIPDNFPLFNSRHSLIQYLITEDTFFEAFKTLKKGREKLDFVFSYLVQMFMASGFNGAYLFIDDFERVPDFQSGRQRRDFAAELRSVLFDGPYENARYGFFNMFLVLHAGVPALISETWASSGLDQRSPLTPKVEANHLIRFEKLNPVHVSLLIKKYLKEYRVTPFSKDELFPFEEETINIIAQSSEYNAATILKTCNSLIEKALNLEKDSIDADFVRTEIEKSEGVESGDKQALDETSATNLLKKAKEG